MGLLDRIKSYVSNGSPSTVALPANSSPAPSPPQQDAARDVSLTFKPREYDADGDDGTTIYGRGWVVHDDDDLGLREDDPVLDASGVVIFKVAGVTFRPTELQLACFNPGNEVALVKEPTNPVDPDAIAVWDVARRHHVGYVPAKLTWRVRIGMDGNADSRAYIWWDWHKQNRRRWERCGLKVVQLPHEAALAPLGDWQPPAS